jgi:hypothetical protein
MDPSTNVLDPLSPYRFRIRIGVNADPDPDPAFYLQAIQNPDPDPGSKTYRDPSRTGSRSDFAVTKSWILI